MPAQNISTSFVNIKSFQGKLALEIECQKHAERAVAEVLRVMEDPATRAPYKLAAAFGILDRAFGKPMERSVALTVSNTPDNQQYQAMDTKTLLTHAMAVLSGKPQSNQPVTVEAVAEHPETTPGIDFEKGQG